MAWLIALCAVSVVLVTMAEMEKVKKENKNLNERVKQLEDEVFTVE